MLPRSSFFFLNSGILAKLLGMSLESNLYYFWAFSTILEKLFLQKIMSTTFLSDEVCEARGVEVFCIEGS